jgi:hypothetical protein
MLAAAALVATAAIGVVAVTGCCGSKRAPRRAGSGSGSFDSGLAGARPPLRTNGTSLEPGSGSASDSGTASASASASAPIAPAGCKLAAQTWRFPAVPRVIAMGDVHGDLAAVRAALRLGGVLDDADHWKGGATWVVQTGDVLDRGDDEQAIIDLFERLEPEANAAGGRFVWLLGNHELMNPAGDLRYVTRGGFRDFEDVPGLALDRVPADIPEPARARIAALSPGGPYARILAGQNVVAIVGDTAFVHGGIVPGVAAELDAGQLATRCWLDGHGAMPALIERPDGPVWDRSFAGPDVDCGRLGRALAELGVARLVVGHTVQPAGISSACDGQVWRIDVGLAAYYGGPIEVLELTATGTRPLHGER